MQTTDQLAEDFLQTFRERAKQYFIHEDPGGLGKWFESQKTALIQDGMGYIEAHRLLHHEVSRAIYELCPDAVAKIVVLQVFERLHKYR